MRTLNCESPAVVVEPSPSGQKLAVGHFNGAVSIYDLSDLSEEASSEPDVTFEGHTSKLVKYGCHPLDEDCSIFSISFLMTVFSIFRRNNMPILGSK